MLIQKTCQHEEVNFEKTYKQSSLETEPFTTPCSSKQIIFPIMCA